MKAKKTALALAVILLVALGPAAAAGAGGLLFGMVEPDWNPSFLPSAQTPQMEFMGGFGYGVTRDGLIFGGFGLAFLDYDLIGDYQDAAYHVAGGVGGMIVGSRVIGTRSLHLDVAARLGLGGMAKGTRTPYTVDSVTYYWFVSKGWALVYAEPYIELGLGLTPWMHLGATLSYPILGNFIPGKPFTDICYFTPVLGFTLGFGDFRKN